MKIFIWEGVLLQRFGAGAALAVADDEVAARWQIMQDAIVNQTLLDPYQWCQRDFRILEGPPTHVHDLDGFTYAIAGSA